MNEKFERVKVLASISEDTEICLIPEFVDMRKGPDGLGLCVQRWIQQSACSGEVYAFCNKTQTRIKMVRWDRYGVSMTTRKLHRGKLSWPISLKAPLRIPKSAWELLSIGIEAQFLINKKDVFMQL